MKYQKNQKHSSEDSLDYIKEVSKTWSATDWENYLKQVEVPAKEGCVSLSNEMEIAEGEGFADMISTESLIKSCPQFLDSISLLVKGLFPREKEVLGMIYWEDKSLSEIAIELKLNKGTVSRTYKRALERLGNNFQIEMANRLQQAKKKKEKKQTVNLWS